MVLTDTHLHLYSGEYENLQQYLLKNAEDKNIGRFFLPNIDLDSILPMKKLVEQFPEKCFPMMGLHPCYVKEGYLLVLDKIRTELFSGGYKAVGEIGIDLYWDKSTFQIQKEAFLSQCRWALELNLPVAIHCRESFAETVTLVKQVNSEGNGKLRGVFHCFTGNQDDAVTALELGFYLGLGGVLTFKNSGLDKVASEIPLGKIVLETDGPYLAPVPHRGKRNEPEYLSLVAAKLAEIKGIPAEEVARITTKNSMDLFNC